MPIPISAAVEGPVDEAVLHRLVREAGAVLGSVYGKKGKDQIKTQIRGYNNAAARSPWLVLVDLDREECAAHLRRTWLPEPAPWMCFRVAIRAVEAWLLADREAIAAFLGIDPSTVPLAPDNEPDPKRTLVDLARRSRTRKGIVPRPGSGRPVGRDYSLELRNYIESYWRPEIAAQSSDSLRRCRSRLRELVQSG